MRRAARRAWIAVSALGWIALAGVACLVALAALGFRQIEAQSAAGQEFGRTTSEEGCLPEAMERIESCDGPLCASVGASPFFNGCLWTSAISGQFCSQLPEPEEKVSSKWASEFCRERSYSVAECEPLALLLWTYCNDESFAVSRHERAPGPGPLEWAILLVPLFLLFCGYWMPTIIAAVRKHDNTRAIFFLNLFGWTGIAWVLALLRSLPQPGPPREAPRPS